MHSQFFRWILYILLTLALSSVHAIGPSPDRDWRSADSPNFRIHFEARHRALAERIAITAEAFHPRITAWLNWRPRERTELVLADYTDQANGMATPLPYNTIYLFVAPPDDGELLQNAPWLDLVFIHEFIHIVHLDKARSTPLGARDVFGRYPLLFPNAFQPNWLTEGLATYGESASQEKVGRLRNSFFEAMMRLEAQRGFLSLREVNASGRGLPLNRAYLYGAYFYDFLARRYGTDAVRMLVERYSGNLLPFRIVSNAQAVTGKPMDTLWLEYLDDLRERFNAQNEKLVLTRHPAIAPVLTAPDLGSLATDAQGRLHVVRYDGLTRPELVRRDEKGAIEVLTEVSRAARIDLATDGAVLIAQPEVQDNHDLFFDLYLLANGERTPTRLTQGGRWREAVWWPGGEKSRIAALRVEADGRLAIWGLDAQGQAPTRRVLAEAGETILGLAADPVHERLVWASQRAKRWQLNEWTPQGQRVLLDDAAIKHSVRIDAQGRIWFIADYDEVPNVWALDMADNREPSLQRFTRTDIAITGLATPTNGQLTVRQLVAEGEAVVQWRMGAPLEIRGAALPAQLELTAPTSAPTPLDVDDAYTPWPGLRPRSWFPALQMADGAFAVGAQIFGNDPLGVHQYTAMPMVETTQREVFGQLSYVYDQKLAMALLREMRVLLTENNRGQKIAAYSMDETAQGVALKSLTRREWRVFAGLGAALTRSSVKIVDGASWRSQDERVGALLLGYDSRSDQWRSEGPSQGFKAEAIVERGLSGSEFPGQAWHLQTQGFLPLGASVAGARIRLGEAAADAESFRLGGSDLGSLQTLPQINQRSFSLRGYDGDALAGRRFRMGALEWRVPIADVDRHLMVPPIGLNRLSMTLFGEVGQAASGGQDYETLRSRGVELFGETRLGYLLPIELRLGYVQALDRQRDKRSYLLMGRSF